MVNRFMGNTVVYKGEEEYDIHKSAMVIIQKD